MTGHNYYISPIKAVENDIEDDCLYVFCSMWENAGKGKDNVLCLEFLDTEEPGHPYRFKPEYALKILDFISGSDAEDIFICCDSGESRSTAITAALVEMEGGDSSYIWEDKNYHPNKLVYDVMVDVINNSKKSNAKKSK